MCIAGSRRGSGESCYQELTASEGLQQQQQQQQHQGAQISAARHNNAACIQQIISSSPSLNSTISQIPIQQQQLIVSRSGSLKAQNIGNKETNQERRTSAADETVVTDGKVQNAASVRVISEDAGTAASSGGSHCLAATPSTHRGSTSNSRRLSDADRLLLEALETGKERMRHTGRFLTMHKRRRKRLTTRSLNQDPGILDDIFHGQVQCLLLKSGNWRFNAFALETVTGGRSLPVLCVHLFHWYGLLEYFKLDVVRVWKLFNLIEEGYHSTNPYHNSIHATDVTQAMHCFLQEEKIRKNLSQLEIMASLIGAVTHDLDHPGVNQPFLVATSNHLAALYENTSVLENHHWRSAIGCLLESGVSEQLEPELRPELERHISSLILATDITRQQEFLTRFKRYLDQNLLDMKRGEDRHFILQIALKCADISNPCRPWEISRKWSHKVCEEFFRQGDYERQLNLPVTPLCDRHTTSIPKIQVGFLKFVVTPLYEEWHRFLGTGLSLNLMDYLKGNQSRWEALIQQEAAEETKTEMSELEEVDHVVSSDDEGAAEDSGSIDLLIPDAPLSRRPSLPGKICSERVGRRHSVPLSVPKLLPIARTIIRRESLPTEQKKLKTPLVKLEDQRLLGHSSLSLMSSRSSLHDSPATKSTERPVSAENLLPEPSIASITNSAEASRLSTVLQPDQKTSAQTKQLTRQQTFPPLQPYVRMRYMSTTAEMSQCTEALIEGDSQSSSTPSPIKDRLCSDAQCRTPPEIGALHSSTESSRRSSATLNVARVHKREHDASEMFSVRRRGSAVPDLMRRQDIMLSPDHARRHSVQIPDTLSTTKSPCAWTSNLVEPASEMINVPPSEKLPDFGPKLGSINVLDVVPNPSPSQTDYGSDKYSNQGCHYELTDTTEATDFEIGVLGSAINESSSIKPKSMCGSMRRFLIPVLDVTGDEALGNNRRFSAIPVSSEAPQKVFFVGTPPDSPPRVLSSSSDSGSEPRKSVSDLMSDSVSVGTKRDSENWREKGAAKILKLSIEPEMKENVDPRTSDDGKVLSSNRRPSQVWARRRSSAPVGLLSKVDDALMASVAPRGDRYSRRGSVPTDMTRHQSGGSNRSALGAREENLPSPRRASLPQETALESLSDTAFFPTCEEANCPDNNNSSRITDPTVPISGTLYLRRGSVPADISELRRDVYNRNSVNGKARNRKKVLRRRSSGGPEMFTGCTDNMDNGNSVRWKRDMLRRDSIPEPLTKRRGSLPIDMVVISHATGSVPVQRKSSLWRL